MTTNHRNNVRKLIILSFSFFLFFVTFTLISEIRVSKLSLQSNIHTFTKSPSLNDIRILIGILTMPEQHYKRHNLRMIYGLQRQEGAKVDVRFVLCNITNKEDNVLVKLEIMSYNDIIILNCKENLNEGKTYTYFSSLPTIFGTSGQGSPRPPYHYVMKTDDDTYIRLDNLVKSLRLLPRDDLYYGYVIPDPTLDPFTHYMSGMGYLVSWDLVEWIKKSDIPKNHLRGPEDKVFGEWLRRGGRAKNRFSVKWSMYNYPDPPTRYGHELWPNTIAVHNLKTQERWIRTLEYFNVTKNFRSDIGRAK
ncbi:hydroxyproline O-galactosyltransferase GALT3-like [Silene latifolia]|uniref:hydroxyproline O-galactosyltransferase GALT3-like n=1 Tax=Silene latifolia TaxID=37657 RepID=UPI003D77C191